MIKRKIFWSKTYSTYNNRVMAKECITEKSVYYLFGIKLFTITTIRQEE